MIERFRNVSGRRLLVEAFRSQPIVEGNIQVAEALADNAELVEYAPGGRLLLEGGSDNHIVFILTGAVSILVSDRVVNTRRAGQHVGEMALIDPRAPRSATVIAQEHIVVASVPEVAFAAVADQHSRLWRLLAVELAARLRQRNQYVRARRVLPRIFIGSSSETLKVAEAIAGNLGSESVEPIVWAMGGVFGASQFPIESLDAKVEEADFAALVLGSDDVVISRKEEQNAPRDNVVFELGLFMGSIKRERTYLVVPSGLDVKIPSDLLGITQLRYDQDGSLSLPLRVAAACNELTRLIRKHGPR